MRWRLAAVGVACLLVAACAGHEAGFEERAAQEPSSAAEDPADAPADASPAPTPATTTPAPPPPDATPEELAAVDVSLTRVSAVGITTALASRPGDDRLWVTQRDGLIVAIAGDEGVPVLDLRDRVSTDGEGGMLGLAFSPDGAWLYLSFTDAAGDSRLDAYRVGGDRPDPASGRTLLHVEQPTPFHNGGAVVVDEAGDLWWGLGDGSSGQEPSDAARSLDNLLGTIVRITPQPDADPPYTIPADNPFVGREGARPEIVAHGLRNPWRMALDPVDGSLWIADVGQYAVEEIDRLPRDALGADFGWNALEGDRPVEGRPAPPDAVGPVHQYGRDDGRCAVIGGLVYRGEAIPGLRGAYVYGDHCDGRIRALLVDDDGALHHRDDLAQVHGLVGFGTDADGELYALSLDEGVQRVTPSQP